MFRLFKKLKPYAWLIVINVVLVAGTAFSQLLLPDRMSDIINNGIKEEIQYEKTPAGEPIYIDMAFVAQMMALAGRDTSSLPADDVPLPVLKYKDAGILVTEARNGRHYAVFTQPYVELGQNGEPINLYAGFPTPKFLRTADGSPAGEVRQGTLDLQKNGFAQFVTKTVTVKKEIVNNSLIMLAITLVSGLFSIGAAFLSSRIGVGFGRDLRKSIFEKVLGFSAKENDLFGTSSLITRATNDVTQIVILVIMSLRIAIMTPVIFIGSLIMALNKSAQMTLVLAAIIPLIAFLLVFVFKKIVPLFKTIQKKTDRLTLVARENITGVRVIRAFGADERENKRYDSANLNLANTGYSAAKIMSVLMPIVMFVMSMTALAIVMVGVFFVDDKLSAGALNSATLTTLGNMMAVIQYVMQIMMSVFMLAMIFILAPRASVSAGRINEVLDAEPTVVDKVGALKPEKNGGNVEFRDVSFSYQNAAASILSNISFKAGPGEVTAIIGSTGSGKSTLINLIPRLYDVTGGQILVDGVDVRDYEQDALRKKIGFVSQKAVLFSGTVAENIAYGNGGVSEEEIKRAAEIAQAADFIDENEKKYDYLIDQGGANLSGGQKQRISIARAIARKPEIYIFDDSFSALDFRTDARLRKALKKVIKESTVIIVAQRIGTVMDADRIIVLQDGRIAGIGKHRELLKTCSVYREIALSQLSAEELGISEENGRARSPEGGRV
jgi:ABC-type multidrug transport system, ATPase and permease components